MNRIVVALALSTGLLAAPAWAGLHFQARTTSEGAQGTQVMHTEGWVEGDRAKVLFTESDNPLLGAGSYLLTSDGGATVYLVNPQEESYAAFDPAKMLAGVGAVMQGMGPLLKIKFSNHRVEKLADEAGEPMHGYDTRHYRFRTTYDSEIRVMGMGQASSNETVTDTWTTTALSDAGFSVWLRRDPPRTGIADLDALIDAEVGKGIQGVPLKMVTVATSRPQKGAETRTTTTMEVTSLREEAVPAAAFQLPAGYQRVELTMPGMPPFGQR